MTLLLELSTTRQPGAGAPRQPGAGARAHIQCIYIMRARALNLEQEPSSIQCTPIV